MFETLEGKRVEDLIAKLSDCEENSDVSETIKLIVDTQINMLLKINEITIAHNKNAKSVNGLEEKVNKLQDEVDGRKPIILESDVMARR